MSNPRVVEVHVELEAGAGMRLDAYVSQMLGLFSRSQARARILEATVNGAPARLARTVRRGDTITLTYADPPALELVAQEIPLCILFENEEVVVIDKPQGMVVHPGNGNRTGTLLNALLFHCGGLPAGFAPGDPRPGIVHRLDKDTSGVIIAAKNERAHAFLAGQFHDRTVAKRYLALVRGIPAQPEGRVECRLARDPRSRLKFTCVEKGGRLSLTSFRTLKSFGEGPGGYALLLLAPKTGRTHQLRVHMRLIGVPILGDPLYGKRDPRFPDATLMLHARSLRIRLPGETEPRRFESPLPERFRAVLGELQSFSPSKGL